MSYKRQYREVDDEVKKKISQASKNKPKSAEHKAHISQALCKYWKSVPHRPASGTSITNGDTV